VVSETRGKTSELTFLDLCPGISIGWGGNEVRCPEYEVLKLQSPPEPEPKPVEEKLIDLEEAVDAAGVLRVNTSGSDAGRKIPSSHWVLTLKKLLDK
jgi:hypothetical protein